MNTSSISIEVDEDSARVFSQAPAEERRKLQLLLALRLRELTTSPTRSLQEIMDDIGARAESRGLTSETLDSLLDDE